MQTYIGKCKTKGCKTALRVDDVADSIRSGRSIFEYVHSGAEAATPGVGYCIGNDGAFARCADHGLFALRSLKGRLNPEHACDARCMNATGPNCECSCGGANHGAGHVAVAV